MSLVRRGNQTFNYAQLRVNPRSKINMYFSKNQASMGSKKVQMA